VRFGGGEDLGPGRQDTEALVSSGAKDQMEFLFLVLGIRFWTGYKTRTKGIGSSSPCPREGQGAGVRAPGRDPPFRRLAGSTASLHRNLAATFHAGGGSLRNPESVSHEDRGVGRYAVGRGSRAWRGHKKGYV